MKNCILFLTLIMYCNLYSQNRFETDSIQAYSLIKKEIATLKEKGVIEADLISIFDDTGKIIIAWKSKEKYKAMKMFYKEKKCKKSKKQRLSKLDKKNLEIILKKPKILSKISNLTCNEKVHSFNKIYVNIKNSYKSFFSHCEQDNEVLPLVSLYFSLRD